MESQRGRRATLLCEFMSPKSHSGISKDLNSSHVESVTIISFWPIVRTSQYPRLGLSVSPPTPHPAHMECSLHSLPFANTTQPLKAKPDNQAEWLRTLEVNTPSSTPSKLLPLLFLLPRPVSLFLCMAHCLDPFWSLQSISFMRPSITIIFKTTPPLGLGVWRHGRAFA